MIIFLIVGNLCKQSREVLLSSRYCRHSKLTELVSDSATSLPETLNEKKIHQFLLLKLKMKLLNQSDSSFLPQPLTKATLKCESVKWRYPQYTQASTRLLEVAFWKYVESIWKKYFEWSIWTNTSTDKKVFKIPKYQILNLQYFKYQIQKSITNTAHLWTTKSSTNACGYKNWPIRH